MLSCGIGPPSLVAASDEKNYTPPWVRRQVEITIALVVFHVHQENRRAWHSTQRRIYAT